MRYARLPSRRQGTSDMMVGRTRRAETYSTSAALIELSSSFLTLHHRRVRRKVRMEIWTVGYEPEGQRSTSLQSPFMRPARPISLLARRRSQPTMPPLILHLHLAHRCAWSEGHQLQSLNYMPTQSESRKSSYTVLREKIYTMLPECPTCGKQWWLRTIEPIRVY